MLKLNLTQLGNEMDMGVIVLQKEGKIYSREVKSKNDRKYMKLLLSD